MRAIDIDYFVNDWIPKHPEWDFYDMDKMYNDDDWQAELPIIEAESVKHGHWIVDKRIFNPQCSVCGAYSLKEGNYCSNCGAKMDSEDIDNDK